MYFCSHKQEDIEPETVVSVSNILRNIISDATVEDQTTENVEIFANILGMLSNVEVNEEVGYESHIDMKMYHIGAMFS